MGASVIPFCHGQGKVSFLFHKTFSGRRAGCLVDFGGGGSEGESHVQTAIREFIEETETMYFADDIQGAWRSDRRVKQQTPMVEAVFADTLRHHPHWYCSRMASANGKVKDWKTFFIEFECKDVSAMNRQWRLDPQKRFKKRRELLWVPAEEFLAIYRSEPTRLWKRLRELRDVEKTIESIIDYAASGAK